MHRCVHILFGFSSRIVYYAVLSRGPHWFFVKSSVCMFVSTCSFLDAHHISLLVTIRCFACCEGFYLLKKFVCIHRYNSALSDITWHLSVFVSRHLGWSSPLPYCWTWHDVTPLWPSNDALCACIHLVYPFICPYPRRLRPCLGCCT